MSNQISKSLFSFIGELSENNNREWFLENKSYYEKERKKALSFFNEVLTGLNKHDELEKLKFFRIYRDVRFSKNKTPYKTHFGCQFIRFGKERRGGYYVHLEPGNSFLGCGFWAPEKEDLFRIRKEIEFDGDHFYSIISNPEITKHWGELYQGNSLKVAPKGFDKRHKHIVYLRKKQFVFVKNLKDEEVLSPNILNTINTAFKTMRPFLDYMSMTLTTDLNGESVL